MRFAWMAILIASSATALDVDESVRMPNWGGYCTFACLGTLGKRHNIPALKNIMREMWEANGNKTAVPGYDDTIVDELTERKISFVYAPQFSYDLSLLQAYAEEYGVVISFVRNTPGFGCHSVLVTNFGADVVELYDPNAPKQLKTITRSFFDAYWLGNSVVVFPPIVIGEPEP